ncbi:hypothetical protein [Alteribacillus sp. YIM 98480]|uniref:hypothetical protein n=1 Tax=Alteribacillus sp. YIM 98480 TaxID=2606599 RepID=UPI00131A61AD|nr:hypothetical protein [Alteribacillus sp. YIM 98480]
MAILITDEDGNFVPQHLTEDGSAFEENKGIDGAQFVHVTGSIVEEGKIENETIGAGSTLIIPVNFSQFTCGFGMRGESDFKGADYDVYYRSAMFGSANGKSDYLGKTLISNGTVTDNSEVNKVEDMLVFGDTQLDGRNVNLVFHTLTGAGEIRVINNDSTDITIDHLTIVSFGR